MSKQTLIITAIIVAVIAIGATATYITLRQGGEEVREQPVGTVPEAPEKPPVQPSEIPSISEPVTQPEIDTSDWKTYKGRKWGWMIKYPPELAPEFVEVKEVWESLPGGDRYFLGPEGIEFGLEEFDSSYPVSAFSFLAGIYPDKSLCKPHLLIPSATRTERDIGEVHFIRGDNAGSFPNQETEYQIWYTGTHQDVCYRFLFFHSIQATTNLDEEVDLFEQIVSTFKLLKEE